MKFPIRALQQEQRNDRAVIDTLRTLHPTLPGYQLLFLTRLAYADPTLTLDRAKMPPAEDESQYDYVLSVR